MSKTKNENIEVIVEDIGDAIIPDYDDFEWDEDLYGEDAPTQIIEGYQDKEIVGGNNSDNLQTAYIEYNSDFEELVKLLTTIIETGEYTEEHKATVNAKNGEYDESYSKVKREISKAQTVSLQNQINDIKSEMLTGTQSEIFNALTKNGAVQGLYLDDNGDIYINAQFLQTRGMSIVNNNNETTLAIDEEGNLTTSGDIVGGTITGAIMRAMKIDTNEVNIESADGGMTIKGALQKFTDENGNVRILIGKDTDGSFKFMLYGENGSTVLIDKNGIKSEAISAGTIKTEHLTPNSISTKHLKTDVMEAIDAKVENMTADKATIGQLNATNANIGTLQTNVAKIDNILAGNITSENIQAGSITSKDLATGTITAGSGIIADGAIGSAQISEINAGKINGGTVDTSKVTVAGANNHLKIQGNRLQVFQGVGSQAKERVSVGDVNGDGTVYGLRVRGADGKTVLMDENGVKSEGITDGSITNDKISDNADIDGAKLNINSVINKINQDGTETINGTKIEVNGQTLNAQLSTITNRQNEDGKKITQAQSQISANTQSIGLKVDTQTYQTDKKNMTTQMNKNTSAIDVMKDQIALKVEQTDINNVKSELEGSIDTKINSAKSEIKVTTDKISQSISSLTQTVNTKADNSSVTSVNNKVSKIETNLSGITQRVESTESTTSTLTTKVNNAQSTANTAKNTADSAKTTATNAQNTANTANSTANTNKGNIANLQSTVSTTNSKVSSLETNLNGITQRVSATETKTTTVSDKLDNLKIGGRNLARNTRTPITLSDFKGSLNYCSDSYTIEGINLLKVDDVLTISYDFEYTNLVGNTDKAIYLHGWGEQTSWDNCVRIKNANPNIVWGNTSKQITRVVSSMTVNTQTLKNNKLYLRFRTDNITGGSFTVKNFMIERGDKPSEWNPAPEDVDSSISTVAGKVDTANKNISSLTTRVSTAESKLTKNSLTTTIGNHYTTSNDVNGIVTSKGYQTQSQVQQTVNSLQAKFTSSGGYNLLRNGQAKNGTSYWSNNGGGISVGTTGSGSVLGEGATYFNSSFPSGITGEWVALKPNTDYIYSAKLWTASSFAGTITTPLHYWCSSTKVAGSAQLTVIDYKSECKANEWNDVYVHFRTKGGTVYFKPFVYLGGTTSINFSVSEIMLCEGSIKTPYSPHPSEIYDGITTIDKDGITVTASNVKSKTNMSADGLKIVKTDTGEEVFKVNSDGTLSIKGNITVTGGSVPTNSLSGTISSNQLNSSITSDINTAKNNANSALNTANNVSTTANSALSTAKNAQSTANNVNNTLNNNKDNWSNAYNRVKEWANGAVTGSTSINGGMIATNTVTANKIAVGDFNNYSQLQKGRNLTNTYGNAIWSDVNAEWTTSNAYFPLTLDNTDNAFNVGDKINIKCSVWVNQSANLPIGVWFYDSNKTNTGSNTSTKTINAGWNHLDFELILNHDSIKKSPYMQILIKTEGNSIAVKDVVITRKISGEMLVDGAITANKLHADAINGKKITGVNIVGSTFSSTSGNFKVLNDGTVDATSLSVNDEISTETLTVQEINNSKYQAVLDRNVIINIDSGGTNSASFTSGATYKSISAFLDACPRCLNGYTVTLNLLSNINENVEINQLHSGSLTINMNGKVIYGYVFLEGESTRFRIYGNKSGSTGGSTFGSIMPNIGMTQAGGCYSMVIHSTQGFFYDLKVYGGKSTDSNIGIRVANWASAYLSAIQFIGCYNGLRTYNLGRAYISSSSGTTTSYAFSAYHGGQVILNPTTQAGKAGATSHVFISNNSTVTSTGVTWSSSAVSGSNTNSSTTKVEKTVTINSTLGDSYRSTTYNSWKKDSTVRQGNYGYGNCEGCWFYGDQFVPYQNKEITKIEITIKRQAGGVAGAVTHTLKMHNHATRPSGRPTFSTALSKNFSLATNNSTTVVLTTTAEINAFKANKGFGLVPTAQNSTYYSVCSGSATVKITYKE